MARLRPEIAFLDDAVEAPGQPQRAAQNPRGHRAHAGLQALERQLHDGIFRRAIHKRAPQRVAHHHDNRARQHRNRAGKRLLHAQLPAEQGDNERLQAVRNKRHEHRRGIEQQVAQKRTHTACDKRRQRIHEHRRRVNHDVVKIQVSTRHGDAQRAHAQHNHHRHEQRGHCQPQHRLATAQILRLLPFLRHEDSVLSLCVFHASGISLTRRIPSSTRRRVSSLPSR